MHPRDLSILDYTYQLQEHRIAQQPLAERDASKLLVYRDGAITDHTFRDIATILPANALLIKNDTRVVHARIAFRRSTGALLECMVLTPSGGRPIEQALQDRGTSAWWCMMGNAKRWKGEELITTVDGIELRAERSDHINGEHLIRFSWTGEGTFVEQLHRFGRVPLPPYMRREAMPADQARYNTVFAARDGSVAAPTASLHFSEAIFRQLEQQGIRSTALTLHVGAGTFLPVKSERMEQHTMHTEQVRITVDALKMISEQVGNGPIIPLGTTALRTLESIYWHGVMMLQGRAGSEMCIDQWEPYAHAGTALPSANEALNTVIHAAQQQEGVLIGTTGILIAPGYTFRFADALVTNFHQPQSTLLLLVAAFIGPGWRKIYEHALANNYRFLSYGDGSLLFRN